MRAQPSTYAGVLLAVTVGAVALAVGPNVIGRDECRNGGDCPDLVSSRGTEYVVMFQCDQVPSERLGTPAPGVIRPAASGSPTAKVTTYAIGGLPADEVVAVKGPTNVVCANGPKPGHGVAFSSKTDAATTSRRLAGIVPD